MGGMDFGFFFPPYVIQQAMLCLGNGVEMDGLAPSGRIRKAA